MCTLISVSGKMKVSIQEFQFLKLLLQQQIMLAKQRFIWQNKRLRRNQLKDKTTKINQRKSGRKLENML